MGVDFAVGYGLDFAPSPILLMNDLRALDVDIRSYKEPLQRSVQRVLGPSFQINFEVGGRPEWEPLADSTVEFKASHGFPEETLIRTGKLRKVAGQLNIWTIDGPSGQAYVSQLPGAEYGAFHQSGTKKMPQREFLVIQEEDEDAIEEVFDEWLQERFARRGFVAS